MTTTSGGVIGSRHQGQSKLPFQRMALKSIVTSFVTVLTNHCRAFIKGGSLIIIGVVMVLTTLVVTVLRVIFLRLP